MKQKSISLLAAAFLGLGLVSASSAEAITFKMVLVLVEKEEKGLISFQHPILWLTYSPMIIILVPMYI